MPRDVFRRCECQSVYRPARQQHSYITTRLFNYEFHLVSLAVPPIITRSINFDRFNREETGSLDIGRAIVREIANAPPTSAAISAETPARCSSGNWLLLLATGALLFRKHLCPYSSTRLRNEVSLSLSFFLQFLSLSLSLFLSLSLSLSLGGNMQID